MVISPTRPYRGMQLVAFPPLGQDGLSEIVCALELLREKDPLRFRRIQVHIKRVALDRPVRKILGSYWPLGKVCTLTELPNFKGKEDLLHYAYAAVLVHESTHAKLDKHRFSYSRLIRSRIEEVCNKEEARFLSKFPGVSRRIDIAYGLARSSKSGSREYTCGTG
jgi:hypothetical protein